MEVPINIMEVHTRNTTKGHTWPLMPEPDKMKTIKRNPFKNPSDDARLRENADPNRKEKFMHKTQEIHHINADIKGPGSADQSTMIHLPARVNSQIVTHSSLSICLKL
jgi:hypothetical protein